MKLYIHPLSGRSHRAQLFLSLAGIRHETVEVDLLAGAHKQPEFLAKNGFGQVPVLEDGSQCVADSNATLVYVAKNTGWKIGTQATRRVPRRYNARAQIR